MDAYAANYTLPVFLEPLVGYLSKILPPELLDLVVALLSHTVAVVAALVSLISALIASKPWEWDAQKVLPPLITLLCAYLALLSVWRTTGWMVRSAFWMVKWGAILSMLIAASGWFMSGVNGDLGGYGGGMTSLVGEWVLNFINGQEQSRTGAARGTTRSSRSRSQASGQGRPKPWESFDTHRQWQYREQRDTEEHNDMQQIFKDIFASAGQFVTQGSWWEATKEFVDAQMKPGSGDDQDGSRRNQPPGKAKGGTKAKSSTSR